LTVVQTEEQRNLSSSSSSSEGEKRAQQQGMGTQMGMMPPVQTTTMPVTMTQPVMGSEFANQGITGQGVMGTS
jgi:hypothetical protein